MTNLRIVRFSAPEASELLIAVAELAVDRTAGPAVAGLIPKRLAA